MDVEDFSDSNANGDDALLSQVIAEIVTALGEEKDLENDFCVDILQRNVSKWLKAYQGFIKSFLT